MVYPPPDAVTVRVRIPNRPIAPASTTSETTTSPIRRRRRARRTFRAGMGSGAFGRRSLTTLPEVPVLGLLETNAGYAEVFVEPSAGLGPDGFLGRTLEVGTHGALVFGAAGQADHVFGKLHDSAGGTDEPLPAAF